VASSISSISANLSLDEDALIDFIQSLIDYSNFDASLGVLKLVYYLKPSLIPIMMRQIPKPELLRSKPAVLQNLLVCVDDESLARFIGAAGERISLNLMENISQNRRLRLGRDIANWRSTLHKGALRPYHKLVYYLSYLFIYQQVKNKL